MMSLTTTTDVASRPSKSTCGVPTIVKNPVPRIVTGVWPRFVPDFGMMLVTLAGGGGVTNVPDAAESCDDVSGEIIRPSVDDQSPNP